jgi:hypothetical protein
MMEGKFVVPKFYTVQHQPKMSSGRLDPEARRAVSSAIGEKANVKVEYSEGYHLCL